MSTIPILYRPKSRLLNSLVSGGPGENPASIQKDPLFQYLTTRNSKIILLEVASLARCSQFQIKTISDKVRHSTVPILYRPSRANRPLLRATERGFIFHSINSHVAKKALFSGGNYGRSLQ
jgi:hypothetical protein